MGSAYFIVTECPVPGYDPGDVEGKMVSRLDGVLDESGFYAARGVKPLYEFCGDDMSEFLDEDIDDELDEEATGERWFDAAEGLASVRAAAEGLATHGAGIPLPEAAAEDLARFDAALAHCACHGIRWYLSIDI